MSSELLKLKVSLKRKTDTDTSTNQDKSDAFNQNLSKMNMKQLLFETTGGAVICFKVPWVRLILWFDILVLLSSTIQYACLSVMIQKSYVLVASKCKNRRNRYLIWIIKLAIKLSLFYAKMLKNWSTELLSQNITVNQDQHQLKNCQTLGISVDIFFLGNLFFI